MFKQVKRRNGFVFVETAIALPMIILLMYTLANVGIKIFELGRNQLADYVLEEEAHLALQRITHQARAAKELEVYGNVDINDIKFVYHAAADINLVQTIADVWETQYYLAHTKSDTLSTNVYAEHQTQALVNPITGDNSFGMTSLVTMKFSELNPNVLHVTLELESLVTGRRIKLSTAVYMPACESKSGFAP